MTFYHKMERIEDEAKLVEELIRLETIVRAKREKDKLEKSREDASRAKIFDPITKSIRKIQEVLSTPNHSSAPLNASKGEMHTEI